MDGRGEKCRWKNQLDMGRKVQESNDSGRVDANKKGGMIKMIRDIFGRIWL